MSNKVYEECVVEGKKRYYEDANIIDKIVHQGKIKIIDSEKNEYAQKITRNSIGRSTKTSLFMSEMYEK